MSDRAAQPTLAALSAKFAAVLPDIGTATAADRPVADTAAGIDCYFAVDPSNSHYGINVMLLANLNRLFRQLTGV